MDKNKVLIVDDAEINRELLKEIFDEQFQILEAADGNEAILILEQEKSKIAIVFLDMIMPNKNGLEVLEYMSDHGYMNYIPVIIITGESTAEIEEQAYNLGASDIIYKPFAPRVILRRSKNIIEMFENRLNMERKLEERTAALRESREKLKNNNEFLVNALSSVVEFRSLESGEHVERVKYYTEILLKYVTQNCPEYGLNQEDCESIVRASALHDIGKIAIPDNILLKPGRLDDFEFDEMKRHTTYGCELLENFKQEDNDFYRYCYEICRWHHEKVDGKGYPDGLKGDDIPIWAQVVSVADVFDALVSNRVYKSAFDVETARRMIMDGECGTFSERLLHCFELAGDEFTAMATDGIRL